MGRGNTSKWKLSAGLILAVLVAMAVALSARADTSVNATAASSRPTDNPPWYPSLQAFEHYDSGRSHVFPLAKFGGSMTGQNRVKIVASRKGQYPSG